VGICVILIPAITYVRFKRVMKVPTSPLVDTGSPTLVSNPVKHALIVDFNIAIGPLNVIFNFMICLHQ